MRTGIKSFFITILTIISLSCNFINCNANNLTTFGNSESYKIFREKSFNDRISRVIRRHQFNKNTETVCLNSLILGLARLISDTPELKFIRSLRVMNIQRENFSERKFRRLNNEIQDILNDMECLIEAKDNGDNVYIYINMRKDIIKDLVIYNYDEGEINLVYMKLNITKKELLESEMMNSNENDSNIQIGDIKIPKINKTENHD